MTAELQYDPVAEALEIARGLARAGVPIFIAPPSSDPKDTSGFRLPGRWQQTKPDPAILDHWQPGWAVCAVMGHGIDLVDLDLYAGAEVARIQPALRQARHYAMAGTASGGIHVFVASLGVRSKNGLFKGIDIKAGDANGKGLGFAFIAPTVKKSKVTGEPSHYFWQTAPDLMALTQARDDQTGRALAELLFTAKTGLNGQNGNGSQNGHGPAAASTLDDFFTQGKPSPWGKDRDDEEAVKTTLRAAGRNSGVMKLACSLRETSSLDVDAAIAYMYERVWPHIDQSQGGHEFPAEEFEATIRAQWRQYSGGGERIQQAQIAAEDLHAHPLPGTALELTDAYITDRVANVLHMRFCWARGLNWMMWNGYRWVPVDVSEVWNDVRKYFIWLHAETARAGADQTLLGRLSALLAASKIRGITDLTRGHDRVARDPEEFDAHPDVINTPEGIVSLRTGEVSTHTPGMLLTKLTSGNYRPGCTHEDWKQALTALDTPERDWYQVRIGQAITGYPPSDGIMPVLQGTGENGKALNVATPMLTTQGWTAMGELAEGDEVYGPDGQPAKVTATYAIRHNRPCYRVTTSDGRSVIADAEHLWTVREPGQATWNVRTTDQLLRRGVVLRTRRDGYREHRFQLPIQNPLDTPDIPLPLDPYVLGAWSGDGSSGGNGITLGPDKTDVVTEIRNTGMPIHKLRATYAWGLGNGRGGVKEESVKATLRRLGVLGNKHIPEKYLTAGTGQRLALLQGLLDTDGFASARQGQVEFCTTQKALADGVLSWPDHSAGSLP